MALSARPTRSSCILVLAAQGDSGAEGDQNAFVVVQEELLGQIALQTLHGFDPRFQIGVRQNDEEFFAAVSSY